MSDGNVDRGQRRREKARDGDVIESDQGDLLWYAHSEFCECTERTDRHRIVRSEHSGRPRLELRDLLRRLVTRFFREIASELECGVLTIAGSAHPGPVAAAPLRRIAVLRR